MKCLGSPLFLIEKYGRFMSLNVTKEEDADNEQIIEFVKSLSKNVEYEVLSEEILFRIPMKDDKNEEKKLKKILDIPTFFKNFDENINNLKIKSYRISMPTLEDVFLNVAAEDTKLENQKMAHRKFSSPDEDNDKYKPVPTIGFGKEVSVMISNFFNRNDYERINNNYMKITKDDEHKIEDISEH